MEVWSREAVVDKVWVKELPDVEFDSFRKHLRSFPGVLGVEKGGVRTYGQFLLLGVDESELAGYGPCAEDPELIRKLRDGHGMILSKRLAHDLKYQVGDVQRVARPDGSVQEFEVIAISDAYGYFPHPDERLYGVISDAYMEQYFCIDSETVTNVAIRLESGVEAGVATAAVRDYMRSAFSEATSNPVRFETGAQLFDHHVRDIDRDFILFDILIGLTAVLATLGVLNGQLLAALERSKEIGVLKALGVTRPQVAGMVWIESLVVGVVGGSVGVLLGSAMTPVVVDALQDLAGLTLPAKECRRLADRGLRGIDCLLRAGRNLPDLAHESL